MARDSSQKAIAPNRRVSVCIEVVLQTLAYERDERRLSVFRQTLIDPPETSIRLYHTNNADSEPGLRSISIGDSSNYDHGEKTAI